MLKGCQRRIIMVKDTGSRYFDSAYFVIKSDIPSSCKNSDMLSEAHKMIDAYTNGVIKGTMQPSAEPINNRMRTAAWLGITAACAVMLLAAAVIALKILG